MRFRPGDRVEFRSSDPACDGWKPAVVTEPQGYFTGVKPCNNSQIVRLEAGGPGSGVFIRRHRNMVRHATLPVPASVE